MEGAVLIVVDVLGSSGEVKVVTLGVVFTRASTPLVLINSIAPDETVCDSQRRWQ